MSPAPWAMETDGNGQSVVVPILFVSLTVMMAISLVRQQLQIAQVDVTDKIACRYIVDDAATRKAQSTNSIVLETSERRYVSQIEALADTFDRRGHAESAASVAFSHTLVEYLQAQRTSIIAAETQQSKNISLTDRIVSSSTELAKQLNCNATGV